MKLMFLCGKMAAGKSTLAAQLARRDSAMLIVQDEWLDRLYPGEIVDVPDYARTSARLRNALAPHVCSLLSRKIPVVLDFPGNTKAQRRWFREIFESAGADHELHLIVASDALCKRQLKERSRHLPPGTPWTTEADFDSITAYYDPPSEDEGFTIVRHERE